MNESDGQCAVPAAVVVNDDLTQSSILSGLLRKAGLEPRMFGDAESALAAMSCEPPPALIVTDLYMPGIDGWRFCRLLRSPEYPAFNRTPILVVSATFAGEEPSRIAADIGADAFLPSPVNGAQFVEEVRAILRGERKPVSLRALIVEDDRILAEYLKKVMDRSGYRSDVALNATAAAMAFSVNAYDIALIDYHLPDGKGDKLLDSFQTEGSDCACLMMTVDTGRELALDWMKRGAAAYLHKPFSPAYLLELCAHARRERALMRVESVLEARTRQLRGNEALLARTQRIAQVGSWMLDLTTSRLTWSDETYRIFGLEPQEFAATYEAFLEIVHPDDRTTVDDAYSRSLREGRDGYEIEHRIVRRDSGEVRIVHEQCVHERDATGSVVKSIGMVQDITKRKRMESMLRVERNLAQALMAATSLDETLALCLHTAISESGLDAGGIYVANPETGAITLHSHQGLSEAFVEAVRRFDADSRQWQIVHAAQPVYTSLREMGVPMDGARIAEDLKAIAVVPIRHRGQAIGCLNVASHTQDEVPEQARAMLEALAQQMGLAIAEEQAREALRESEEKHRRLFETMAQGVIYQNADGGIVSANPAAERILGLSFDQMRGKTSMDPRWRMILEDGTPVPGTEHPAMVALRTGRVVGPVTRGVFHPEKNSHIWLSITAIPLFAPGAATPHQAYATFADITAQKRAEDTLRESEERYRTLFERTANPILVIDTKGDYVDANESALRFLECSHDELLKKNVIDFIPPGSDEVMNEHLSTWETGGVLEVEYFINAKVKTLILTITPGVRRGQPVVFGDGTDITERKRAEEENRIYRTIAEKAVYGKAIADLHGNILYVNRFFADIHGYSPEELIGRHLGVFHTPAQMEAVERIIAAMTREGHFEAIQVWHAHRDGTEFPMLMSGVLIGDEDGAPQCIAASAIDMTEFCRTEQAYHTLFREMLDGFALHEVICDADGRPMDYRFLAVNPAFERMTGLKAEDTVGRTVLEVLPGTEPHWIETYGKVALTGEPAHFEDSAADLGKHFEVTAFCSAQGRFACIFQDITERKQAEAVLRESEERLRLANKATNDVVWDWDIVHDMQRWNEAGTAVFGWTEIVERPVSAAWWVERVHPDDRERVDEGFFAVVDDPSKTDWQDEYRFQKADGNYAHVMDRGYVMRDAQGKALRMVGAMLDITERKRAEEQLRQDAERRQRQAELITRVASSTNLAEGEVQELAVELTEAASRALEIERVGVWLFNDDRSELVCVDNYEASRKAHASGAVLSRNEFQHEFDCLESLPYVDAHDALTDPRTAGYVEDYLKPNNITSMLDSAIRIEGRNLGTLCLEHVGEPHRWREDEITIAGQLADHVALALLHLERKRAEETLRKTQSELSAIYSSAPVMICLVDEGRRVLYANPAFINAIGSDEKEVTGERACGIFGCVNAQQDPRGCGYSDECHECPILYGITDTFHSGDTHVGIEKRMLVERGGKQREIWLLASTSLVQRPDGPAVLICMADITMRKQAEEERETLQTQLQQSQKLESVGRLAGGVAHDINNMLSVILGHTEIALAEMDSSHELYDDLREIHAAAERSTAVTRQLLAFARKQTIAPRVLDLNEIVENQLNLLQRLIGEDIALSWGPGTGLWPVRMDPGQVDQIVTNLCVNARDAISGVGHIHIETATVTVGDAFCADRVGGVPGDYVLLQVSDDGCGIAPENLAHVFEPFFTTKSAGKGTGLGLATVYGIVRQNSGFIDIHSEPGQGTVFNVYLPRYAGEAAQSQKERPAVFSAHGNETILLVEDEPGILDMLVMILQRQGYSVLAASTPSEAIRLADNHPGEIHLLVTDVIMPEMNGRDLANRLQTKYTSLKCLFMSGYTADVIAHHGVLEQDVHFLQKPFSISEIGAKVRETIGD